MVEEYVQVVRVYKRVLGRLAEKVLRVRDYVLIQRRRRSHHDKRAHALPPSGAPGLLPGRRDGARIAAQHAHVQSADVYAQLQRIGGHNDVYLTRAQFLLDLMPERRQIAAAVRAHVGRFAQRVAALILEPPRQHLDHKPRAREHDRMHAVFKQQPRYAERLPCRGIADVQLLVHDRRVVEYHMLFAGGRARFGDKLHRPPGKALGQLTRVGDGRGAAYELRMGAVKRAYTFEPPDDVCEVGAEYAAVGVNLVDDDVFQVFKQLHPLGVVRQYARVQHVRIGHDDVPRLTYGLARRNRRVAVERERLYGRVHGLYNLVKLGHLIAGQRLGREKVQRARLVIAQYLAQNRQVVAHGLARGGGRDYNEVLARLSQIQRAPLMRVEPLHAARFQHCAQRWVETFGIVGVLGRARGHDLPVRHVGYKIRVGFKVGKQLAGVHARSSPF